LLCRSLLIWYNHTCPFLLLFPEILESCSKKLLAYAYIWSVFPMFSSTSIKDSGLKARCWCLPARWEAETGNIMVWDQLCFEILKPWVQTPVPPKEFRYCIKVFDPFWVDLHMRWEVGN
jgi:hypothetical protein